MKYVGRIYGKIGGRYIPLQADTGDLDKAKCLLEEIVDNYESDALSLPEEFIKECKEIIAKI